jgi:hypothetical protein
VTNAADLADLLRTQRKALVAQLASSLDLAIARAPSDGECR